MKRLNIFFVVLTFAVSILSPSQIQAQNSDDVGCHYIVDMILCESLTQSVFSQLNDLGEVVEEYVGKHAVFQVTSGIFHIRTGMADRVILFDCDEDEHACDKIEVSIKLTGVYPLGEFGTGYLYDLTTTNKQLEIPIAFKVYTNCASLSAEGFQWRFSSIRSLAFGDTVLSGWIQSEINEVWELKTASGHLLGAGFVRAPSCWGSLPSRYFLPKVSR